MNEYFQNELPRRGVDDEEWMNCYFRKLASLYRKSACLWKKDTRHYLDSERRHQAYSRIHQAMNLPGVSFIEMVLKIREMRRLYVNELKRLLDAESSGHCYRITLPWFYVLHRFLYPYLDYDEAIELQDCEQTVAEPRESNAPIRDPLNCSCVDYPLSGRNHRVENFLACRGGGLRALNSISSPVVSMPEVKTRPRSCSRSCSGIEETRKQLHRFPSPTVCETTTSSNFCHEKLERRGNSNSSKFTETGQEACHEFRICGLCNDDTSSSNSYDTDSNQIDSFSTNIASYLRKLDKRNRTKEDGEIQKILNRRKSVNFLEDAPLRKEFLRI